MPTRSITVTLGVDTHKDIHVAVALDQLGRRLGVTSLPTDDAHHQALTDWAGSFGRLTQAGVEGTGSFGYRLAQYLTGCGVTVFEVNRPNRTARRRRGKSDPVDAENAARAVLSGDATAIPKSRTGPAGQLRALLVSRRSATKVPHPSRTATTLPHPRTRRHHSRSGRPSPHRRACCCLHHAHRRRRHQHRPTRPGSPLAAPRCRSPRQ